MGSLNVGEYYDYMCYRDSLETYLKKESSSITTIWFIKITKKIIRINEILTNGRT